MHCGVIEEDFFKCLSHCKSMGVNDPRGGASFWPKGHDSQDLCKAPHNMLQTKYRSFGSCGIREGDLFMYFPL